VVTVQTKPRLLCPAGQEIHLNFMCSSPTREVLREQPCISGIKGKRSHPSKYGYSNHEWLASGEIDIGNTNREEKKTKRAELEMMMLGTLMSHWKQERNENARYFVIGVSTNLSEYRLYHRFLVSPNANLFIFSTTANSITIRAPIQGIHLIFMPGKILFQLSCSQIPDLDCGVPATTCQETAVC